MTERNKNVIIKGERNEGRRKETKETLLLSNNKINILDNLY
jgi:hypothetical protein